MTVPPEALEPHQQRLLPTSPEDVAPTVRDELGAFCEDESEVEAAYVCRVERVWPGREPQQSLSFIVKLAQPIAGPDDARSETRAVCDRFIREHADLARELGVGVLADRAVPAWDKYAQKVWARLNP
ncbi:MAG TPA: hypothetical protein VFM41_02300 [Gaiella sp.]|nr:hypothetical protein [Gaiella sp.]